MPGTNAAERIKAVQKRVELILFVSPF